MAGTLYLCATPIGNLEDMSFRAVRVLKEADLIAAEDTRNSIRLLNHFDIHTPMTSYHEYNRIEKAHELIRQLQDGKNIALITDAGMPGISDPGEDLVRLCRSEGIEVTAVPGACACIDALVISGMPARRFAFEAFLPSEKKERARVLEELKDETRTVILYEAPHHLVRTLKELHETLGEREIALCRELTKLHETVYRSVLSEAIRYHEEHEPRGEYVLVLEGADPLQIRKEQQEDWQLMSVPDHVLFYEQQGMDRREAMKAAAKDRGVGKREIYQALLDDQNRMEE